MPDVTDDEWTVLLIAVQGQYLAPIGRWKKPVLSLTEKGLMQRLDSVNYVITDAGKTFAEQRENQELRGFLETGIAARNQHEQARQAVEEAAKHLAVAARASGATGDDPKVAAERWSSLVLQRALEMLRETNVVSLSAR